MAEWTFDGTNKVIKEPLSTGDTTHEIPRDVYSAWKRWVQSGNAQYDQAMVIEGGTPIGATGLFTGYTVVLVNGWKLMGGDWDHQTILLGNLYSDDGVASVANPSWNANIFISASVAAQGVATGGGSAPTVSEIWSDTNVFPAGSKGDQLANAGGAGNPWSAPISGNTNSGTFGELVGKKLLKFSKWFGLKK